MIEREAQLPRERKLVAAVIYNRLKQGIPLGIDATIRYATGNWQQPLTQSQLALDSPYNTRTNAGLPPGPIGNPGLASLQAAARPARVGYLYYVVKPGTCGEHAFSSTFAEFERDQQRYNEAREAAGRAIARRSADQSRVLGHPVGHSRSPGDAQRRLPGARPRLALRGDRRRAGALRRGRAGPARPAASPGANVTIPHKLRGARGRRHAPRAVARAVGAANTLVFARRRGSTPTTPTCEGFLTALRERAPEAPAGMRALVLGAGGAGAGRRLRAARGGRRRGRGLEPPPGARARRSSPTSRRRGADATLAATADARAVRTADLLVNATSVGMVEPRLRPPAARGSDPFKELPLFGR